MDVRSRGISIPASSGTNTYGSVPYKDTHKSMRHGKEVKNMFSTLISKLHSKWVTAVALCTAGLVVTMPAIASAEAGETKEKVKEVATKVGSEGVEIVLAILTALIALLVAVIIIPKAVGLIKRFI